MARLSRFSGIHFAEGQIFFVWVLLAARTGRNIFPAGFGLLQPGPTPLLTKHGTTDLRMLLAVRKAGDSLAVVGDVVIVVGGPQPVGS
jgi:hypothetical protein